MEELEKERDTLAKRRDTLDLRLKDNRVLTEEVRKTGRDNDRRDVMYRTFFHDNLVVVSVYCFLRCDLCVFM